MESKIELTDEVIVERGRFVETLDALVALAAGSATHQICEASPIGSAANILQSLAATCHPKAVVPTPFVRAEVVVFQTCQLQRTRTGRRLL